MKTSHWTARSIKDYLFRIAADFISQLENKMEALPVSQDELAKRLGITKGRVSQFINHPGNISLGKMIEYAKALGMKVSIIAYEDNDPENKRGPVDSEIFRICWEHSGKPRDFWSIQDMKAKNVFAANIKYGRRIDDYKNLFSYERKALSINFFDCPTYYPVMQLAANQTTDIFERDKSLPL